MWNADDWTSWVGITVAVDDRQVEKDTWRDRLEEVVAVRLVDRLVLAGCKSVGVEELGK